jgi:hypothetical protein
MQCIASAGEQTWRELVFLCIVFLCILPSKLLLLLHKDFVFFTRILTLILIGPQKAAGVKQN